MSNWTDADFWEIAEFCIKNSGGIYTKLNWDTIIEYAKLHVNYKTIIVVKDKEGILAVARWNIVNKDTAHILDVITRKKNKYKGATLLKRILMQGLKNFPQTKYMVWERLFKYPKRKPRKCLISHILNSKKTVEDSRFSDRLREPIANQIYAYYRHMIMDIVDGGWVRFTKDKLDSIYVRVKMVNGHLGYVKFLYKNKQPIIQSIYIERERNDSGVIEERFNLQGELIHTYVHEYKDGIDYVSKLGTKESYECGRDIKSFPLYLNLMLGDDVITMKNDKFIYFTKKNKDMYYLLISNKNAEMYLKGGN